ncbi:MULTISPECIES: hypothetical protein [Bacillaceae]|uniref:Uncharacterized protein n=2 Tax=Bacillaceae TaxID=186817 RepID=A0A0V8JQ81_9BACI|nr:MULTISPECIES: hypothetical protein [Bacillaceae]KSU89211.1 hypothetical protein AS180_03525 [Priestia veravalensis]NMO75661.1 hypothetical protein [Niallia alba]SCB91822.1 hypothetical protein GA0061087_100429 [Priestia flexa]
MENLKEELQDLLLGKGEKATVKEAIHDIYSQMEIPDIRVKLGADRLFDVVEVLNSKYKLNGFFSLGKEETKFILFVYGDEYGLTEVRYSVEEAFVLDVVDEAHMLAFLNK